MGIMIWYMNWFGDLEFGILSWDIMFSSILNWGDVGIKGYVLVKGVLYYKDAGEKGCVVI